MTFDQQSAGKSDEKTISIVIKLRFAVSENLVTLIPLLLQIQKLQIRANEESFLDQRAKKIAPL